MVDRLTAEISNFNERLLSFKTLSWQHNSGLRLIPFQGSETELSHFLNSKLYHSENFPYTTGLDDEPSIRKWVIGQPSDLTRLAYQIKIPESNDIFDGFAVWHHISSVGLTAQRGITIFKPENRGKHWGHKCGIMMMEIAKQLGIKLALADCHELNVASVTNLLKCFSLTKRVNGRIYFERKMENWQPPLGFGEVTKS
jgi:hypothetical protein